MRLWTLHPKYLDGSGLVSLWREALLAREVLRGRTRGYRHHPQLLRFRRCEFPRSAINAYIIAVYAEALSRGYKFDRSKLARVPAAQRLVATNEQLSYEWSWLLHKLEHRDLPLYRRLRAVSLPDAHPLFSVVRGPVCDWERVNREISTERR